MSTADMKVPVAPVVTGVAPRVLIISAPYYEQVVGGMRRAAEEMLVSAKAKITNIEVSGAYELPQALAIAAQNVDAFDGYIALGCVVRGETDHYDFICSTSLTGLMNVATQNRLCLGTAVLTVDTLEQAQKRSAETGANKGAEAAVACLKQIALHRQFAQ